MPCSQRISALFENVAGGLADEVATLAGQLRKEVAAVTRGVEEARAKDLVRLRAGSTHLHWVRQLDDDRCTHIHSEPHFALN